MFKLNRFLLALAFLVATSFCLVLKPDTGCYGPINCASKGKPAGESKEIEQAFDMAKNYLNNKDFISLKEYLKKCENYKLSSGFSFIDALSKKLCLNNYFSISDCDRYIFLMNNGADYSIFSSKFIELFDQERNYCEKSMFDSRIAFRVEFFSKNGMFKLPKVGEKLIEQIINYSLDNKLEKCILSCLGIICKNDFFKYCAEGQKKIEQLVDITVDSSVKNKSERDLITVFNIIVDNNVFGSSKKQKQIIKRIAICAIEEKKIDILQAIVDSKIKISRSLLKKINLLIKAENPIVSHAKVLKELKEYFNNKNKKNNEKPIRAKKITQTESYLRVWFDKKDAILDYDSLIERILKENYSYIGQELNNYRDLIKSMLERERKHPDHYVFYHANNACTQIVFDIQTSIIKWLKLELGKYKDIYLRFNNFVAHDDIKDFYKDCDDKIGGYYWYDSAEPMRSQVLSVNLCPFGNTRDQGECTLYYFINGISIVDPSSILSSMFNDLGFCKDYINRVKVLYSLCFEDFSCDMFEDSVYGAQRSGNMLQIFIPKDKVDKFVYLSFAYGKPFSYKIPGLDYDESKERHTSIAQYLDKYVNDPYSLSTKCNDYGYDSIFDTKKLIDFAQGRIVFMPNFYDKESGIKFFKYNFASQESKNKYKKAFEKIIDQMMGQWIDEKGYEKMPQTDGNKKLLKLLRYISAGNKQ